MKTPLSLLLLFNLQGVKKTGGRMHGDICKTAFGLNWFPAKLVAKWLSRRAQ